MNSSSPCSKRALWRRAFDRLVSAYNWRFRKRQHVYVFDSSLTAPTFPPGWNVERFERVEDVAADVWDALGDGGRDPSVADDQTEMRARGVLWVARLGGTVVGAAVSRRGRDFVRWFVRLGANDIVIFRVRTLPAYRGRGIAAALLRAIVMREALPAGEAYTDCRTFNLSSIRMIEKAGFRRIATVKSLTRQEAIGVAA